MTTQSAPEGARLAGTLALLILFAASAARAQDDSEEVVVLTLEQALEQTLANNLDIRTAVSTALQAEAGILAARGPFDPIGTIFYQHATNENPTFNLTQPSSRKTDLWTSSLRQTLWYGGTWEIGLNGNRSDVALPPTVQSTTPTYSVDAVVTYTQPLLQGLGRDANRAALEQAINNAAVAKNDLRMRARDVLAQTTAAYWELVFAVEDLEVRRGALGLAENLMRQNRIMVEVGTLAPLEVLQSEASVALRQRDIITGRSLIGSAEDLLRQYMGLSERDSRWWGRIVPADQPEFTSAYVDLDDSLDAALSRRRELDNALLRLENAQLELNRAKDAKLPQLDFVLSLSTAGLGGDGPRDLDGDGMIDLFADEGFGHAFDQVYGRDFNSWNASLRFTQPLFDRAAKAEYTTRRLQLNSQEIDLARIRQAVILDVRSAVRDVETAREQIAAAQSSRTLQEKVLDAEVKKFENGLSTNFEVLQLQTDLTAAESAELRAIIDYAVALVELRQARGELLSESQANSFLP